ncbi:MAG: efflux RND transporter periplasmic adaptor subunit [Leptolyngbyaceae cyanobacterium SL_7_1]|nr:efflux RND transporter periplasmic adaptor subunit [Leptolyngbyaceae cyanobacterium SL_7_1]
MAEVELQTQQYNRTASLVSDGVLPQQELDVVERDRQSAIAQLNAIDRQIQAAQATVAARTAAVAEAQATVERAAADLGETTVTAPFAGTVGDIPIKVGDQVSSSSSLTSITQNDTLELRLQVPLERRAELRQGLRVELTDQQDNNLAIGQISFISPQVDTSAQSILAKASFNNTQNRLLNGQYVRARVIWQERPGILVPSAAISRIGGQAFVFVAKPPEAEPSQPAAEGSAGESEGAGQPPDAAGQPALVAEQRLVTLGDLQGNTYQILEGLQPGEQIVVSGILNLSDGAPIRPNAQPPNAQPPEGEPPQG